MAVLRARPGGYADAHPEPRDTLLVIEVADTSVERDRTLKIPLYAAAGIAEAWLVHLLDDEVQVHRHPAPGGYRETRRLKHGTLAVPGVSADVRVKVDEILP